MLLWGQYQFYIIAMSIQPHTLTSGTFVDNYQIHRVLGVGGFGITYQAHDMKLNCAVAIKEYFPVGIATRQPDTGMVIAKSEQDRPVYDYGLQRFMDEARVLAQFKDPNIVRVSRYLEKNGTAYIIMDYEEGVPLSRYLMRCKTLTETEVKNVFHSILKGLATVHALDYLHRDIKPPNIYLRKKGSPVLLDFGAARQAMNNHERTVTNLGTRSYAPVEQFTNHAQQGPWSDLYAVGATIYHCVVGQPPMNAVDRVAAVSAGQKDPYQPIAALRHNEISRDLGKCIDWMLSIHSHSRPQSIQEVLPVFDGVNPANNSTILGQVDVDWDAELLAQAERHLTKHLGPMASIVITQCMDKASSIDELYMLLAGHIDTPSQRDLFLKSVQASGPFSTNFSERPTRTITQAQNIKPSVSEQQIRILEQQLAFHIGPLAKMLVKQALETGADIEEVIEILASELPTEDERSTFKRKIMES